jgi:hypothetical protein
VPVVVRDHRAPCQNQMFLEVPQFAYDDRR